MKFRCDRDALSEALQTVQRGVSSRPGIPALTGVLLEASPEGRLMLSTTDLEVSARLSIDVQVGEAGVALVPARLLGDTVKSLSDAPVDVETDRTQARIRCSAYEGSLRLLPAEDFPGLQEPGGTHVEAEAGAFAEAVSQVARRQLAQIVPRIPVRRPSPQDIAGAEACARRQHERGESEQALQLGHAHTVSMPNGGESSRKIAACSRQQQAARGKV